MKSEDLDHAVLDGRLPILPQERVFATARSFTTTCITFGAAIWVFLVGSLLPSVGNVKLGIVGYTSGLIIGFVPCVLASGVPSFRFGIDTVDASKSVFGVRGAFLPMIGILCTSLAWSTIIMAMVAQGVTKLVYGDGSGEGAMLTVAVALVVVVLCWLLVRKGLTFIQQVNNVAGPALIALATLSLALLLWRFGWDSLWTNKEPEAGVYTTDPLKSLAYALEFGIATSLAWWPYLGGMFRAVKHRRHVMTPSMIGLTLVGGAYCSSVAALAASAFSTSDPLAWITLLGGPVLGTGIVILILFANIAIMGMLIYFAGVSVQQLRPLAHIPWSVLLAILLVPVALAAFSTSWVLTQVATVTVYVGMQFVSITAIGITDYYLLRGQHIDAEHLFARLPGGRYWFWGGINWVAVLVVALGSATYIWIYNPVTLETADVFRYLGASIPVMLGCAVLYYLLMRLIARAGVGSYPFARDRKTVSGITEVGL
ncbi:cytosine permease [Parahaliea maris]|uniref:cytosine permease n=1 Tax=Parahaliea maris TaxID=2716870 RepID=UPI00164EE8D1|nr:cytosine permease [Parahaliea maris]